jgi:arsenite methyltransferase
MATDADDTDTAQLAFDADVVQRLETLYSTRDAKRRRSLVLQVLAAQPGEQVLDIGCGAGFYLAELLDVVGPDGSLIGVDSSPAMLAMAARRCARGANVSLHEADATALPLDGASVDAALSVQVFEYIRDPSAALAETHRVLRPGGRAINWDVDWATISWHSDDPARMHRALRTWNEHLADPSLPRTLAARMRAAGFENVALEAHVFASGSFDSEAYGTAIIPVIQDFIAGRAGMSSNDALAWALEQRQLGDCGEFFFSCAQFCFQGNKR